VLFWRDQMISGGETETFQERSAGFPSPSEAEENAARQRFFLRFAL
jgi:hypothetical protein